MSRRRTSDCIPRTARRAMPRRVASSVAGTGRPGRRTTSYSRRASCGGSSHTRDRTWPLLPKGDRVRRSRCRSRTTSSTDRDDGTQEQRPNPSTRNPGIGRRRLRRGLPSPSSDASFGSCKSSRFCDGVAATQGRRLKGFLVDASMCCARRTASTRSRSCAGTASALCRRSRPSRQIGHRSCRIASSGPGGRQVFAVPAVPDAGGTRGIACVHADRCADRRRRQKVGRVPDSPHSSAC